MRSRLGALLALTTLFTLVAGVNSLPANAAPYGARLTRPTPIVGEFVKIYGYIPPATRPIRLQLYRSGHWATIQYAHTSTRGRYLFAVRATATMRPMRTYVPAVWIKHRHYLKRYSNVVRLVGHKPSLGVSLIGTPVGRQVTAGLTTPGHATFHPARPGRLVTVQKLVNGAWTSVISGRQNAAGIYWFQVPASTGTLRAVSHPSNGVAAVASSSVVASNPEPAFEDDFADPVFTSQHWATRDQPPSGLRLCSQPSDAMTTFGGGIANLTVKKVGAATLTCPHGVWSNAMIGTANAPTPFTQQYGVFAARVKFEHARGQHGSFWLQGSGDNSAEIDTAEYFGDNRVDGGLSNYVHPNRDGFAKSGGTYPIRANVRSILGAGNEPADDWHVYSVEWNPSGYTFRLDGRPTFHTTMPYIATATEGMVLSLLTSDWELPALDTAGVMRVDWVRAWPGQ